MRCETCWFKFKVDLARQAVSELVADELQSEALMVRYRDRRPVLLAPDQFKRTFFRGPGHRDPAIPPGQRAIFGSICRELVQHHSQ